MQRTTVRLSDDLLEQAKTHARRTGRTFTQLLEDAVKSELSRKNSTLRVAEPLPAYTSRARNAETNSSPEVEPPTAAQRERSAKQLIDQVHELQVFLSAQPILDSRTPDEILGYNSKGLPE